MMPWTTPERLEHAISDGINMFIRDVLIPRGLIDVDRYDADDSLIQLKYAVAQKVAMLWIETNDEV